MKLEDSVFSKRFAAAVLQWSTKNNENFENLRKNLLDLLVLSQENLWTKFVENRSISDREKIQMLQKIYQIDSNILQKAVVLLEKKKQISQFNSLIRQIVRQKWGCVDVVVPSKEVPMKEIQKQIAKMYGELCGVCVFIEPSILGGCILFDGKKRVDTTISGSLKRIQNWLHKFSRENTNWAGI